MIVSTSRDETRNDGREQTRAARTHHSIFQADRSLSREETCSNTGIVPTVVSTTLLNAPRPKESG
jgi:hypothetical protein